MLNSLRMRLTLWYIGVLAVMLLAFGLGVYTLLAHNLNYRFDVALSLTIETMTAMLKREMAEGETIQEAALSVMEDLYYPFQSLSIRDEKGNILAEKLAAETPLSPPLPQDLTIAEQLIFYTLPSNESNVYGYRVVVRQARVPSRNESCIIIVSQSRKPIVEDLKLLGEVFSLAIPIAIIFAGLGGWLLVRKSLAPITAMSVRAQQITAEDLDQGLPVINPHDELGKLAEAFNALLARLKDSFAQQRQFMADASHELRTPLHVMRTAAEVTLERAYRDEQEYRDALTMIQEQVRRLSRIVEDMFLLARADACRRTLQQTHFYLDELILETVYAVKLLATRKGVEIKVPSLPEIPYQGDENLLRQMILNLLDNAIKYTPLGGLVSINLTQHDAVYEIRVVDTGIGIPIQAQPHIFERFYRADESRSRIDTLNTGAGLGLAIARWIAELHQGKLELCHSDSQGTVFAVTLPLP